jgi:dCTP deaminase
MAFWSTETLVRRAKAEELIQPFDRGAVKHGAYQLSLGEEVFVTGQNRGTKAFLSQGRQVAIPPGQFAHLLAAEKIRIPDDAIGFISIRAAFKFEGLVNVSGFHVDPGFHGQLVFSVYNAGSRPVVLARGDQLFLLWFATLDGKTEDTYRGANQDQKTISSTLVNKLQGKVASPGQLQQDLERLRFEVRVMQGVGAGFFAALLALAPIVIDRVLPKPAAGIASEHERVAAAPTATTPQVDPARATTPAPLCADDAGAGE